MDLRKKEYLSLLAIRSDTPLAVNNGHIVLNESNDNLDVTVDHLNVSYTRRNGNYGQSSIWDRCYSSFGDIDLVNLAPDTLGPLHTTVSRARGFIDVDVDGLFFTNLYSLNLTKDPSYTILNMVTGTDENAVVLPNNISGSSLMTRIDGTLDMTSTNVNASQINFLTTIRTEQLILKNTKPNGSSERIYFFIHDNEDENLFTYFTTPISLGDAPDVTGVMKTYFYDKVTTVNEAHGNDILFEDTEPTNVSLFNLGDGSKLIRYCELEPSNNSAIEFEYIPSSNILNVYTHGIIEYEKVEGE